jgi:hypothetical protein
MTDRSYVPLGLSRTTHPFNLILVFLILAAAVWGASRIASAEAIRLAAGRVQLIMVDEKGCHYCQKWNRDVGGVYARTAEGRFAPLRRVGRDAGVLRNFKPVVYTPTFILVRNGGEEGRITGYPGEAYFWEELGVLLNAVGYARRGAQG